MDDDDVRDGALRFIIIFALAGRGWRPLESDCTCCSPAMPLSLLPSSSLTARAERASVTKSRAKHAPLVAGSAGALDVGKAP